MQRRCTAWEYYGLDVHKLSNTCTCMSEEGRILCRGRVATAPEAIRKIAVPSGGQNLGSFGCGIGAGAMSMTPWNPWASNSS